MSRDLKIPRAVARERSDARPPELSDDAPETPIEHVAIAASIELERLEKENKRLGNALVRVCEERDEAKREKNELLSDRSVWALTTGGRAVIQQDDILAHLVAIRKQLDAWAQWATAFGLEWETVKADAEFAKREVTGLLGRVGV